MSESKCNDIFPAVMYRSLDYVFETATSFKVTMDLLALPMPYVTRACDVYPHSGYLPEDTYRTPWTRGNAVSTCKLFLNNSALDDLRINNQLSIDRPESITLEESEVIPSSNPDSFNELDINETGGVLAETTESGQETFSRIQINQTKLENKKQELSLAEDLMEEDHLKQFKRHLPSLKAKLSRLRMCPVADPLLSFRHEDIAEDPIYRRPEPFEIPPQSGDSCSSEISPDTFSRAQLNNEELLLPTILEISAFELEDRTGLSNVCDVSGMKPETMVEQNSVNEIIQKANQDTPQVEIYEPQTTEISMETFAEAEHIEQMKTSADMEVDVTLSPVHKDNTNICLSSSKLSAEPLSPQGPVCLVSVKSQQEQEKAVWTAEKHPSFVLSFMLTDPQAYEPPVDFHPLSEALRVLCPEKHLMSDESVHDSATALQTPLCSCSDFTERIQSDITPSKNQGEEFKKMCPEQQDFYIPTIPTSRCSLSIQERPEDPIVSDIDKPHQKEPALYCPGKALTENLRQPKTPSQSCPQFKQKDIWHNTKENSQTEPMKRALKRNYSECVSVDPPGVDPLSTFIMLRSQQPAHATAGPLPGSVKDTSKQVCRSEPQTHRDQTQRRELLSFNTAVSGKASRDQRTPPLTSRPNEPQIQPRRQDSEVLQVQATECQLQAYRAVLSFAQNHMSFVQTLGLDPSTWGDFSRLTLDQTHFLLKQQQKALNSTSTRSDEELLQQVALIHVLVTFKELLLKCGLSSGLEFLKQINMDDEFNLLLKQLQITLNLSHKKLETDPKLLELQKLLKTWLNNKKDSTERILILISNDKTRSTLLCCLHQLIGSASVANLQLEKDQMKLKGSSIVSSVCNSVCAVVCEQHIGPDFPWHCFCRLVEYDHPGPSPWASVCRDRGLLHIHFTTVIPANDSWPQSLEGRVPHVLFVTDGLLNCSMLLQTLESTFNITLLERHHSMTLQMLGGTHQYAVITVDESTAIVIQKEEELCQERASEALVMRLSALSLQYSCCWFILLCPDGRGGGLSREAFSNLVLVYSSLVIFSMKSEDLDVKVLLVSDVMETASWISQICFHTLMSSERDPVTYLDRHWLTVLQSNEEKCLLHFPCINPLVGQLMLKRAPSLQWLLSAPLPELKEMLPEVPHKVLKLFSDTTSLYTKTPDLNKRKSPAETKDLHLSGSSTNAWFNSKDRLSVSPVQDIHFPFGAQRDIFFVTSSPEEQEANVRFKLGSSFLEPDVCTQNSWTISDLWKDNGASSNCGVRSGTSGKMVGRADLQFPHQNCGKPTHQMKYASPFTAQSSFSFNRDLQLPRSLTPPGGEDMEWSPGFSPNMTFQKASATYGSKSFVGQERKRSGDSENMFNGVLRPLKRSRLSYEKVPGRSDGQTRLKLL